MAIISPDKFFLLINLYIFFFYLYSCSISYDFIYFKKLADIFKIKKKSLKLNKISATLPNAHV